MKLLIVLVVFLFSVWNCQSFVLNNNEVKKRSPVPENNVNYKQTEVSESGKPLSLTDVDAGNLYRIFTVKQKRCPSGIVGAVRNPSAALPIQRRDIQVEVKERLCETCKNSRQCKQLGKCDYCQRWCGPIAKNATTEISEQPIVGQPVPKITPKFGETNQPKKLFQFAKIDSPVPINVISKILGVKEPADIEELRVLGSTKSNNPPSFDHSIGMSPEDAMKLGNLLNDEIKQFLKDNPNKKITDEDIATALEKALVRLHSGNDEEVGCELDDDKGKGKEDMVPFYPINNYDNQYRQNSNTDENKNKFKNPDVIQDNPVGITNRITEDDNKIVGKPNEDEQDLDGLTKHKKGGGSHNRYLGATQDSPNNNIEQPQPENQLGTKEPLVPVAQPNTDEGVANKNTEVIGATQTNELDPLNEMNVEQPQSNSRKEMEPSVGATQNDNNIVSQPNEIGEDLNGVAHKKKGGGHHYPPPHHHHKHVATVGAAEPENQPQEDMKTPPNVFTPNRYASAFDNEKPKTFNLVKPENNNIVGAPPNTPEESPINRDSSLGGDIIKVVEDRVNSNDDPESNPGTDMAREIVNTVNKHMNSPENNEFLKHQSDSGREMSKNVFKLIEDQLSPDNVKKMIETNQHHPEIVGNSDPQIPQTFPEGNVHKLPNGQEVPIKHESSLKDFLDLPPPNHKPAAANRRTEPIMIQQPSQEFLEHPNTENSNRPNEQILGNPERPIIHGNEENRIQPEVITSPQINPEVMENRMADSDVVGTPLAEEISNNFGKIVPADGSILSTDPQHPGTVFFIGNGIKLPLQMHKKEDGTVDLSVDLDQLCNCQNSTCPKNHKAIEEAVGTILEKEAELKNELDNMNPESRVARQADIYKRSPDFTKNTLEDNANTASFLQLTNTPKSIINLHLNEKFDDLSQIRNAFKFKRIEEDLEEKLKVLDDNVKKYNENNEKMLANGTKAIFKTNDDNENVKKQVDIVRNVLGWMKNFAISDKKR